MVFNPTQQQIALEKLVKDFGIAIPVPSYGGKAQDTFWANVNLGIILQARLNAVGGAENMTQLLEKEKPDSIPQMPTISVNNISDNSASVNWIPYQYDKPTVTSFHFVLKNQDTGQTIFEDNLMSGARNSYLTNLEAGTNYKGYLIAVNAIGNSTENSIGFKTTGIKVEPEPEPITYCVNVYTLDSGGNVLSDHYDAISIPKFEQLISQNKFIFLCKDGIIPTEQQVRDHYGYTAPVEDSSINSMMISQSVGAFILKDGRVKGEILYIANTAFNSFYYGKNLTSLVQIKSKSGIPIVVKPNNLNFTNTERDERIQIDEAVGNFKELIVDFFVWKSTTDLRQFSADKQIQVVEELPPPEEPDFKPCQIGYHKDFSGKCVPDDPLPEIPRDKLIDTLKGFLFGTVALSLLARKN